PGVTIDQARVSMNAIARRLGESYPISNKGTRVSLTSYYDSIVQNVRPVFYMLLVAVGLLLVMACVNAASLTLARAESRQREFAVRAAIGAPRGRLLSQVLMEAALLAGVGASGGLGLSALALRGLVALKPTTIPRIDLLAIDWRVAAFAFVITALSVVLFA